MSNGEARLQASCAGQQSHEELATAPQRSATEGKVGQKNGKAKRGHYTKYSRDARKLLVNFVERDTEMRKNIGGALKKFQQVFGLRKPVPYNSFRYWKANFEISAKHKVVRDTQFNSWPQLLKQYYSDVLLDAGRNNFLRTVTGAELYECSSPLVQLYESLKTNEPATDDNIIPSDASSEQDITGWEPDDYSASDDGSSLSSSSCGSVEDDEESAEQ